jgi:hypothetical protein
MNSDMNILLCGFYITATVYWRLVYVADLTKTPSGDIGEVTLSDLNCIYVERFAYILPSDGMRLHINPYSSDDLGLI